MSCRPVRVRQTAKTQDLCFVTAYGSDLIFNVMHCPRYHEQIGFELAHHIKFKKFSCEDPKIHVLHHPSEQVRQNNHRMV